MAVPRIFNRLPNSLLQNWSRNMGFTPVMGGNCLDCPVKALGTADGRHSQDG
jgi:hypothetical protein